MEEGKKLNWKRDRLEMEERGGGKERGMQLRSRWMEWKLKRDGVETKEVWSGYGRVTKWVQVRDRVGKEERWSGNGSGKEWRLEWERFEMGGRLSSVEIEELLIRDERGIEQSTRD